MTGPLQDVQARYPMAPLIRFTLISLYLALVVPLPIFATGTLQAMLWLALPLGLALVLAAYSLLLPPLLAVLGALLLFTLLLGLLR